MKSPFPWDLPAGTSDHDPKAPWNAKSHCKCCPLHEDNILPEGKPEPDCTCGECDCGKPDYDAINDAKEDR